MDIVAALTQLFAGSGMTGVLLFALVYALATALLCPTWIFNVAAGVLFGFGVGCAVSAPAALAGALLGFLLARYAARDAMRRWFATRRSLVALDAALGQGGWKGVALMRLSLGIPFNLANYFLGTTALRARDFALGSFIGSLPAQALYVFLGATGRSALEGSPEKWAVVALGLAATLALTVYIGRLVRRELRLD